LQSIRKDAGMVHNSSYTSSDFKVNVAENTNENFSTWLGGSILASTEQFYNICHSKAQYEEEGARIVRHNAIFKAQL